MTLSIVIKCVVSLRNYVAFTVTYGFTRAVTYDYEGTKEYYNKKTYQYEKKPMLVVDNFVRILGKTLDSVVLWPFIVAHDLKRLECFTLGKDIREYSPTLGKDLK